MNPLPRLPDINYDHYSEQCKQIHKVTKDCINLREFGEWNPHIVLVDNTKFATNFTDTERQNHWMNKPPDLTGDVYYEGSSEDNLGPCMVIPALTDEASVLTDKGSRVVKWMEHHNGDTLFGVKPYDDDTVKVLKEHTQELKYHEYKLWNKARGVVRAVTRLAKNSEKGK